MDGSSSDSSLDSWVKQPQKKAKRASGQAKMTQGPCKESSKNKDSKENDLDAPGPIIQPFSPLKQKKTTKKGKKKSTKKMTKKSMAKGSEERLSPTKLAAKELAKLAAKKNVQETDVFGQRRLEALEIEKNQLDLEAGLKVLKDILAQCQEQDVPDYEVQRFLARILDTAKASGFLVGVDSAVFKMELDHINVLEASLNGSAMSWEVKKAALNNLLKLSLPKGLDLSVLDQSREGNSWEPRIWPKRMETASNTDKVELANKTTETLVQDQKSSSTQTNNDGQIVSKDSEKGKS